MTPELETQQLDYRVLPYAAERLDNRKYVVSSYFGGWTMLSSEEIKALRAFRIGKNGLYTKLKRAGIILNKDNLGAVVQRYVSLNRNLFLQPGLHIINTTNVCNYRCHYCHAGVSQGKDLMSIETAAKIVKWILENSGPRLMVEFQGGEALLNWKVVKFVVEQLIALNKAKKEIKITIVSNLSLLDEEKLRWLMEHDVELCSSLDGPAHVHNAHRKHITGKNTYEETVKKIRMIQDAGAKFGGCLATISRDALAFPKELVDTYVELGLHSIHLRPIHNLGDALNDWPGLSYTAEEFIEFWKKSMEYILQLNKQGTLIAERGALLLLTKILKGQDPLYVELMSPTGMGRGVLLYNFDGSIYSSDEGRMLTEPVFKIGTVDDEPNEVLGNDDNINMWAATFMDLFCYSSAFRPWLGVQPVLTYQSQGHIIPNITENFQYKIHRAQFKWLFERLCEPENAEILKKWITTFA